MQGIIILALKSDSYACAAANLAASIKHYNKDINITLVTDGTHLRTYNVAHLGLFDWIKEMNICDYTGIDGFCPAKAKLSIYKYSTYSETLYIDADSLVLQDIQPLFNKLKGNEFKTNNIEGYTQWIDREYFCDFFGVDYGYTVNSSWYYFESNKLFIQALQDYEKGLEKKKMFQKWGNTLADEIFFNAAITKLNINPVVDFPVMFFGNVIDPRTLTEIQDTYFAFTLFGDRRTVRDIYVDFYDRNLYNIWAKLGLNHNFKANTLLTGKHVNKR